MAANLISLADEFFALAGPTKVLGDPTGTPAYLYCRSSDKIQAQEGSESLARQLFFAHEKAAHDRCYIPLEMTYWDIWRGKDADRPAFQQLLSDVKKDKRSDIIYIDQTDRLSRDRAVYYVLRHDLTRYGLTIRFGTEEDDLVRHIKLVFDELELEKRRYRQIQANRARASKGNIISKYPSFGYDISEDHMSYIINEEKAQWVRRIFDWYISGKAIRWIAKAMTESGVLSPLGKKVWSTETIRELLRKETYKGVYIANRYERLWVWEGGKQKKIERYKPESEWIYVDVPAIVSEQQWEVAQSLLATNKQKASRNASKNEWLLSGIVRCVCGYSVIAKRKKDRRTSSSGKVIYYYEYYGCWHSPERWRSNGCTRGLIAKERLEKYVIDALEMLFMRPDLWEQYYENPGDQLDRWQSHVALCEKQILEIDAQMAELLELTLEQRSPYVRQLFTQKQTELEEQRNKYQEQLKIARDRLNAAQDIADQRDLVESMLQRIQALGGIASLPYAVKRVVLTRLVDEIILDTHERWFEIKGSFSNKLESFLYTDGGEVVSTSGSRPCPS